MVETFKRGQWYEIVEDYNIPVVRPLDMMLYELRKGDKLRFRGPNLGYAEFLTSIGQLVILKPEIAFRIIGNLGEDTRECEKLDVHKKFGGKSAL